VTLGILTLSSACGGFGRGVESNAAQKLQKDEVEPKKSETKGLIQKPDVINSTQTLLPPDWDAKHGAWISCPQGSMGEVFYAPIKLEDGNQVIIENSMSVTTVDSDNNLVEDPKVTISSDGTCVTVVDSTISSAEQALSGDPAIATSNGGEQK
jgi:hypothetical protein